jgi:hypothetical protein
MTAKWIAHGFILEDDVPEVGAVAGDWVHIDPAYSDCPVRLIRRLCRDQSIRLLALAAGAQPWTEAKPAAEARALGRPHLRVEL